MKIYLIAALLGFAGLCVRASPTSKKLMNGGLLVGADKCTWGPSFWCQNFSSAAGCQATRHCIQTVWEHQTYPTDHDDVCTICKKMVKEARDQLNSNETEEEIKQVFEGSCKLIYIKPIVKECIKIVDDFAPQLIDALSSQMDPNTVCSVAGLCNSARIDKLLEENKETEIKSPDLLHDLMTQDSQRQKCTNCVYVMNKVRNNLAETPEPSFIKKLLSKCRDMGSFSDSCSTLVVTHAPSFYHYLQDKLNEEDACFLGGLCVGVKPNPLISAVEVLPKAVLRTDGEEFIEGDIACDMCVALVQHFKDNVSLNTTAQEFKKVLLGICRNMRSFNKDCQNLVEAHFEQIYDYLRNGLVPKEVCDDVGICHGSVAPALQISEAAKAEDINVHYINAQVKQPLNPMIIGDVLLPANLDLNLQDPDKKSSKPKIHSVPLEKDIIAGSLPVELYSPHAFTPKNQPLCTFCDYFLHFIQVEITDPSNEKHIKDLVKGSCKRMPNGLVDECQQFIDQFGDAVIAMLVHQIDPSQICPSLHVCPSEINVEGKSCPLCLLAVKSIEDKLENNKTEENIKVTLEALCSHLPGDVRKECDTFIIEYFDDLIDMLVADFTPQEVCTYLKLCTPPKLPGGDITTNEIYDGSDFKSFKESMFNEISKPHRQLSSGEGCFFCTLIMNALEQAASNRDVDEKLKQDMIKVCQALPDPVGNSCKNWLRKYGDIIIDTLNNFTPKEVCQKIQACTTLGGLLLTPEMHMNLAQPEPAPASNDCPMCKRISAELKKMIDNSDGSITVDEALKSVCARLPLATAAHMLTLDEYGEWMNGVNALKEPMSLSSACQYFVDSKSTDIMDALACNFTSEELCLFLGSCPLEGQKLQRDSLNKFHDGSDTRSFKESVLTEDMRPHPRLSSGDSCFYCTLMMNALEESFVDRKVDEQVEEVMMKVCNNLPDPTGDSCMDWLQPHLNMMIDTLHDVPPKEVCRTINACTLVGLSMTPDMYLKLHDTKMNNVGLSQNNVKSGNLDGSTKSSSSSGSGKLNIDGISPTAAEQFDEGECKLCLFVVGNVKEQIPKARGQTEPAEIRRSLTGLCSYLKKPESKNLCTNYVEGTGENVIDELANVKPRDLCIHILACPSSKVLPSQSAQPTPGVTKFNEDPGNLNLLRKAPHHYRRNFITDVSSTMSDDDRESNSEDDLNLKGDKSSVSLDQHSQSASFDKKADHEMSSCELCLRSMFSVGPLMNDANLTFEQVHNTLTNSCNTFSGERYEQCKKLMKEYGYIMAAKLFSTPKTPFYEVCYVMTDPLCSGAYMNKHLRDKLMDLFLSEFPKNFRGDAETFEFAREVSELVATVLFFRDDLDYIGTLNPSTSSTTERTTIDHEEVDNDDGDNETSSISEKEDDRNGTQCEICNEVIRRVEPYIRYPILQQFLHSEIDKACDHIQPLHFSKCLKFVTNYGNMLHETALYNSRNTEDLCSLTEPQFCSSISQGPPTKKLQHLGSGSLVRAIALKVCEHLVEKLLGQLENVCQTFLDRHWPEENHYEGDPDLIRPVIKDCDVCQEMMTTVSLEKKSHKVGKFNLRDSLYDSCEILYVPHRWQCRGVLRKYGDEMVSYATKHHTHLMDACTKASLNPCHPRRGLNIEDTDDEGQDQAEMNQLFVNMLLTQVHYYNNPNPRLQRERHRSDEEYEDNK
nr:PREDICTED: uncharacterized protein LOC109034023 isoform X2 [Bemisia tabaci]